jgi:hypothetical protein
MSNRLKNINKNRYALNQNDELLMASTQDFSESIDEENLKKFLMNPKIKHSYFGSNKSSIERLGEHNIFKGKHKHGEFNYNGHYKGTINRF